MAQTKTSQKKRQSGAKSSSAQTKSKSGSSAAKSRSTASRSSSNGSAPKAKKRSSSPRSKPKTQSRNGSASMTDGAIDKAKSAGHAAADVASKAKTPLIAGGTALAGAAAGLAIKSRVDAKRSKNPLKRLGAKAMPAPRLPALSKVDLKSVKSAAEKVSAYGQQAADIAAAAEKTNKKNG